MKHASSRKFKAGTKAKCHNFSHSKETYFSAVDVFNSCFPEEEIDSVVVRKRTHKIWV